LTQETVDHINEVLHRKGAGIKGCIQEVVVTPEIITVLSVFGPRYFT